MIGYKACPLCEKADEVFIDTKKFYEELLNEHGSVAFSIECKRCHLELTDYITEPMEYAEAHDTLAKRWNALPRWQKVCIKFEGGQNNE